MASTDADQKTSISPDDVLRTPEAAKFLGVSAHTLNKSRAAGGGPPFIMLTSRAVGYIRRDLDAYRESRRFRSTTERDAQFVATADLSATSEEAA